MKYSSVIVTFLFVILTYPLFYYAYKFGTPDFGNIDFYHYYHLYRNFDFSKVPVPFNTRIVSPFFVYLFYKTGIYYPAEISYSNPAIDLRVFFSSIAVNYLFFVATLMTTHRILNFFLLKDVVLSFLVTLMYGYAFATLFYSINTLTESASVFLFACAFYLYLKKSKWVLLILFISVFQREYILMAFALISAIDFLLTRNDRKYYLFNFLASVLCFLVYLLLRQTVFYTPHHDEQLMVESYLHRLLHPGFPPGEYIRQSFLNQNIFLLYLLVLLFKKIWKIPIAEVRWIWMNVLLYLQINLISFLAVLGNSTGRYFSILLPLTFYSLIVEVYPIILNRYQKKIS